MNPASLLALVTARAIPFEIQASSYQRITQEDVLHAMGSIKHGGASLLIRVKWAGQEHWTPELDRLFWLAICAMAKQEKWSNPKSGSNELYRKMGQLALAENISPNICLECGGCGKEITPQGKLENCKPCRGSGKSNHSDRSRARLLGMPWETFRESWVDRYRRIQGIADAWESLALSAMHRKITEPVDMAPTAG